MEVARAVRGQPDKTQAPPRSQHRQTRPLPACIHTPRTSAGRGRTGHEHTRSQPLKIPTMHLANLPELVPKRVPPKSSTCDNIKYSVKVQNKLQCDIPPKH